MPGSSGLGGGLVGRAGEEGLRGQEMALWPGERQTVQGRFSYSTETAIGSESSNQSKQWKGALLTDPPPHSDGQKQGFFRRL